MRLSIISECVKRCVIKISQDMKYFCLSEAIAHYLQKFIIYRKRKVFVGKRDISDLTNYFNKHKAKERFLLPCSNLGSKPVVRYLENSEIDFQEAMMYRTVSSDLSDLRDIFYDVLVFFSPLGIKSLYENFPDFKQNETRIAVYGRSTSAAVKARGLTINILAPAPETPSMTMHSKNIFRRQTNSQLTDHSYIAALKKRLQQPLPDRLLNCN